MLGVTEAKQKNVLFFIGSLDSVSCSTIYSLPPSPALPVSLRDLQRKSKYVFNHANAIGPRFEYSSRGSNEIKLIEAYVTFDLLG